MAISRFMFGHAGAVSQKELNDQFGFLLGEGETFEAGFKVVRDTFIFTNKRLLLVDVQGFRGKKKEFLSIPYSKITKYSLESAGSFDLEAELKVWIGSDPAPLEKTFNKKVDVYELQRILATHVLK